MNEADARLLEPAGFGLIGFVGFGQSADAMALQAAMDGAARQLRVHAAAHGFGDVVERQQSEGTQFADQRLPPMATG